MSHEPEQEQIDHWLSNARYQIDRKWSLYRNGHYEKNHLPVQGMYTSSASMHASLGRARYLNGDAIETVRECFAEAARYVLKSFRMAHDPDDPDYLGASADSIEVHENTFIEGAYWALMSADWALAATLGAWFRDPPDGDVESPELNDYAHALALQLREATFESRQRLRALAEFYQRKPAKGSGWRMNYYTQFLALHGIAERDTERLNEGLERHLDFYYRNIALGEERNTDEGYICDAAVALANLGLRRGLQVTVQHDLLPQGLLVPLRV